MGPAYYNPELNKIKKEINHLNNNIKKRYKDKNKFILKTEPFFQANNIKILNSYNFSISNRNRGSSGN